MKTILTPTLPLRLRLHEVYRTEFTEDYSYVIGIMFEPEDDDHESVFFSYICTNGNVCNDGCYTPECFIDGMWTDWE